VQLLPTFLAASPILKQFILTVLYHAPRNLLDGDEVEALTGRGQWSLLRLLETGGGVEVRWRGWRRAD
jgi:hypothetical protein